MENLVCFRKILLHRIIPLLLICFCIPLLTSCESKKRIVNNLEEREANEIIVFLSKKGIQAEKVKSTEGGGPGAQKVILWDISVNTADAINAMSILNQSGLPRRAGQSLLGIFSNSSLVPSELQEEIKYQQGLSAQISSTIRKIDGILDAEIVISFPKEDPLRPQDAQKDKITASVYVKHSGVLDDPNTHLITKIKRLVSASVTGLDYDNVTIVPERARFTDLTGIGGTGDREYVSVWTLIIAKESLTRFRIIFFSFTIIILILLFLFIWFGWKIFPVLNKYGGFREIFHLHPIIPTEEEETPPEGEEGEEGAEEGEAEKP